MTELLYLKDSYIKEFDAHVVSANGKHIILDCTAFYPQGGGQPTDTGKMVRTSDGSQFNVVCVSKSQDGLCHELDKEGLEKGDTVRCTLDWDRRYKLMRMHTAAHLLSAIFHMRAGVLITGNQLDTQRSRIDFSLENFDREIMADVCDEANALIKRGVPVKSYSLPRSEAMKIPDVIKLAGALPPNLAVLRIVEIEGVDKQADGGTHVANLSELKGIEIVKMENKGKINRRVYFTVI